jgi:hypothetical protein
VSDMCALRPRSKAMIRIASSSALVALSCLLVLGCGGKEGTSTVSGKVTYQGQPVTDGLINFVTNGGRPLGGSIGADGTYSTQLPPGEYKVRIDTPPEFPAGYKEGDPLPKLPPRQVPEKYANFNSSGLTATVKGDGSQTIDFAIP